jgi:hypothetical protein
LFGDTEHCVCQAAVVGKSKGELMMAMFEVGGVEKIKNSPFWKNILHLYDDMETDYIERELKKVEGIRDSDVFVPFEAWNSFDSFIWMFSPQGREFWENLDNGYNKKRLPPD